MELRQLRYFVAVARHRHFTRAAEEVGVAQPALSQQIRNLERELGVLLFDRTSRRVQLTEAGKVFLARAEALLAEATRAQVEMQEFAGLVRGRVTIGAVPSLDDRWLAALLARFYRRYPGIELALREETTAQVADLVARGRLDLALLHRTPGPAAPGLAIAPLFTEDLVLAVAPDHPLAGREGVALHDVREAPWILLKPGSAIRQTVLEAAAVAGYTPHIACESGALTTVRALASAGLGVAVLPRSVAVAEGSPIAVLALGPPRLTRTVALAWREGPPRSAAAAAFLAFARAGAAA